MIALHAERATREVALAPGLLGIASRAPGPSLLGDLARLRTESPTIADIVPGTWSDASGHWALSATHVRSTPRAGSVAGVTALVHGDIHNLDTLRILAGGDIGPGLTAADLLARAYRHTGPSCFARLEGAYCAVVVNEEAATLTVANDLLGTFPTYWHHDRHRFAFGPSLTGLLRALSMRPVLDRHAVADYIHFGFVLGDRTLAEGVQMVPAGAMLVYDWRLGDVRTYVHQRAHDLYAPRERSEAEYREAVREEFNAAVDRTCRGDGQLGLSLSGGLDSRAILSAIDTRARRVSSYTVGASLCADDVIARQLSKLTGTAHVFRELDDRYLRDFLPNLERMVALTDGMYLSHGLTEMLALEAVQETGMQVLLRGHCGEMAKSNLAWPMHTDPAVFGMTDAVALRPYVFARPRYLVGDASVNQLFADAERGWSTKAATQSLDAVLDGIEMSAPNLCSYLYLTQHHRRFTVPSLELFRSRVDVRLPFADQRFLSILLGGRAEWRADTTLHRHITGRNNQAVLRVRNSNTGAPGSAGPLLERMFDPVNSVLKKLNVPGYRHYHRFDLWMRQQLLSTTQEVLLDDATLRRGAFTRSAIDGLIDDTRRGAGDHAYLLQILLVVELWQRQVEAA